MKRHMYCNIGRRKLTFGAFATPLNQIEAILHSRPITSVSNDSNDALDLTLERFPIRKPITASPELTAVTKKETTTLTRQN